MICGYISRGDWNVADAHSILASKTYYMIKLKTLLNLKFRYAKRGSFFSPSHSYLKEYLSFGTYANFRDEVRAMKKLLTSADEVQYVHTRSPKKNGRKIVDIVYDIAPSDPFISSIIEANRLNRRAKDALISSDGEEVLIEPLERDFPSRTAYENAKQVYDTAKGKILHSQRHLTRK